MENKERFVKVATRFFETIGQNFVSMCGKDSTLNNVDFIVTTETKEQMKCFVVDMEIEPCHMIHDELKLETHDALGCISWWFWNDADLFIFVCANRYYVFEKEKLIKRLDEMMADGYAFKIESDKNDWTSRMKRYIVPVEFVFKDACLFYYTDNA